MADTPILFSARTVIQLAYEDVGVFQAGEAVPPAQAQTALQRLNAFINQCQTQEFTFPFIARQVLPIASLQSTYTIGPGGDFDVDRPVSINGAGLLLQPSIGTFAITGVDRMAGTFTVAGDQTGSFLSGSDAIVTGSTGNDGSYTIVSSVFGTATTITVDEAIPDATVDGSIEVFTESAAITEIPIGVLTDDAYQSLRVKGMGNTQFTQLYYNATYARGLGTIWLWPQPNTAVNALVLYVPQAVIGFADLTTQYSFPPGYADFFEYNLAKRLMTINGMVDPTIRADIIQQATTATMLVKRQNVKLNDMPIDWSLVNNTGGLYNILSGQ